MKTANRGRETWIYQSCSLEHSSLWNNHSSLKGLLTKHHTLGNNTRCSLKPANCERMDLLSAVSSNKIPVITDPMDIYSMQLAMAESSACIDLMDLFSAVSSDRFQCVPIQWIYSVQLAMAESSACIDLMDLFSAVSSDRFQCLPIQRIYSVQSAMAESSACIDLMDLSVQSVLTDSSAYRSKGYTQCS